jgi:hypothetical protein
MHSGGLLLNTLGVVWSDVLIEWEYTFQRFDSRVEWLNPNLDDLMPAGCTSGCFHINGTQKVAVDVD